MSVIEDTRKVLQDFIAPELKAIEVRLSSLEDKVTDNERRSEQRHVETLAAIRVLADYNSVSQRVARLEAKAEEKTN
jgi:hypothetical protein